MKKIIALLLAMILVASLVACGGNANQPDNTEDNGSNQTENTENTENTEADKDLTAAGTLLADFKAEVGSKTVSELAESLVSKDYIPFAPATMEVTPGYLNGFDAEITGFAEGAMFGPMIGTIPFIGYIFRLDDGADVNAFMQTLKDHAMLNWNICTTADEMVCEAVGNTVFFVMSPLAFEK